MLHLMIIMCEHHEKIVIEFQSVSTNAQQFKQIINDKI